MLAILFAGNVSAAADGQPWPAPVPGFTAPEPGEHPRLFFRKADLPEIKGRAATPEGLPPDETPGSGAWRRGRP